MPDSILVLPGFACTSSIWLPLLERLGTGGQFTLVDWPPHLTPDFHDIDNFASWLSQQYPLDSYTMIIGHSLGGLVASRFLARKPVLSARFLLVESFLLPPSPFFQNLLMPGSDPALIQTVTQMIQEQRKSYSAVLQKSLRSIHLVREFLQSQAEVSAVYGDRGQPEQAIHELGWPEDLYARVPVSLVPHACHFPMLENPDAVANILAVAAFTTGKTNAAQSVADGGRIGVDFETTRTE